MFFLRRELDIYVRVVYGQTHIFMRNIYHHLLLLATLLHIHSFNELCLYKSVQYVYLMFIAIK